MFNKKEQIRDIWGKTTILHKMLFVQRHRIWQYNACSCFLDKQLGTLNENKQPCLIEITKYVITTFTLLSFRFRVGKWQIFFFVSPLFCSHLTSVNVWLGNIPGTEAIRLCANDPEREDDRLHEGRLKESHRSEPWMFYMPFVYAWVAMITSIV